MKGNQEEESIGFVVKGKVKLAEEESSEVTGESTSLLNSSGTDGNVEIIPAKHEDSHLREACDKAQSVLKATRTPASGDVSRQTRILLICCTSNFLSLCCVSLQAPFYPKTVT